jgi:hypothetical protein
MVTAILIPIICIYFYWLSKKELKQNDQKWLGLNEITEEAVLNGTILQIHEHKKRFYYHRYIHVVEIKLQTETKTLNVKRIIPYIKPIEPVPLKTGDQVKLYGNWKENDFHFLRYSKNK